MQRVGWMILALFLLIVNLNPSSALANGEEPTPTPANLTKEVVRSQLDQLQTQEVESFWNQLQTEYGRYFEGKVPGFFDLLFQEKEISFKAFFTAFAKFFFHEVMYNGKLLGAIVVLTVFSMLLQTMQNAFENNQVSKVAYAIVFLVIVVLAVDSFSVAIEAAKSAIEKMIHFMFALVPLLLTLLGSMGNLTSVTLFHPLIIFMIHVIGTIIYTFVFPLLFFSTILAVVSTISSKYKVNQLAGLLRKVAITVLGGLLTIFLGVISIQGATTAVADGVTIRTAKYITGNFVPVVGRTISEAADTVAGASLLMKNTIGLAGVVILLMICAFPALKILTLAFIYNFSAAIMQPLGNSPVIESLSAIGKTLIFVFAALAAVGLMFFLAITIVITSGNISLMMR
ncbi:stage III sporulation protein AE [Thermoactinomyces sp. DSM 45892]|uniref:stage III sporulation protein AE n=1 Tax=Thermoactinomyces sp. DSM 45892 TaxID=1882753 RepID=UPI000899461B|nr:stage III sporulation protein AE [Thermoactinomyces sp. DSM 45892]SDX99731.1 stage III sporulation protein AE [Thermoactinomyces sp. DSM 45892]